MSITNLTSNFKDLRPQYERFTDKIESLIKELISKDKIEYHLIESRTKEINSLQEKVQRKHEKYSELNHITDLSALRIIVYYPTDISKVIKLIRSEFEIDEKNSKISGEEFNPNEFGYLSSHLVISLKENRRNLPEWSLYKDLKGEVQIRTVLQHSWASISHALQYKNRSDIPSNLQRQLFRLAGLFELADDQFVDIKRNHEKIVKQIKNENIIESDRELNLLSVSSYLKQSNTAKKIYSLALECGFVDESNEPTLENDVSESISELIEMTDFIGIKSVKELEEILQSLNKDELELLFNNQIGDERDENKDWFVSLPFIIVIILIYYSIENIKLNNLLDFGWHELIAQRVIRVSEKTKKTAHNNGYHK